MIAGTQAVADLLWAVNSPSLISEPSAPEPLHTNDVDAARLMSFLAKRPDHRVGRYFESLVLFWLQEIRGVEIVASSLQVRDGTRTIGEIDFIFRDTNGHLNHWETAIKFFLHCPQSSGSHFPGPNASDNFERKMTKLFEKQLRLSESAYPEVSSRRAFVRGRMFYHPEIGEPHALPLHLSSQHQRGVWIRESELQWFEQHIEASGCIAMKPHWLAPPVDRDVLRPTPTLIQELTEHFERTRYPAMVLLPGVVDQMFVVPNCWPEC